ncbi:MAG: IS701 family transposase [Cyanobacteria bacterium P01_A01_bin.83]
MVTPRREASPTVGFIDHYCQAYQNLFSDVRNYEAFKLLHLGMLSEIPRKSLTSISRAVGLRDSQGLNHFLRKADWSSEEVRKVRLWLTKLFIGEREVTLCIDETGDAKKGKTTDYTARQYIGNLGKTKNGIVSVNAYAVVEGITYPLIFKIFKPKKCLQKSDTYRTKPQLAVEIIEELQEWNFKIKLVLADSLYGESGDVITVLHQFNLKYIVAIRSNHQVGMLPGEKKRYNRWKAYQQKLSRRKIETRYIREIIFGYRRDIRFYQVSKKEEKNPETKDSWFIMTNLEGKIATKIAPLYSLRNWIEYGFKQVKNELGWADFRVTDYHSIERWWELIMSTYLLVSIQANYFQLETITPDLDRQQNSIVEFSDSFAFSRHPWWESGHTWKSALNNLRLIIQPLIFFCLIRPWLSVFSNYHLQLGLSKLINIMNRFRASPNYQSYPLSHLFPIAC